MYQYADETRAKLIYITILAIHVHWDDMGLDVRKPVLGGLRTTKAQTSAV